MWALGQGVSGAWCESWGDSSTVGQTPWEGARGLVSTPQGPRKEPWGVNHSGELSGPTIVSLCGLKLDLLTLGAVLTQPLAGKAMISLESSCVKASSGAPHEVPSGWDFTS